MSQERTKAERFLRHLQPLQASLEAYCRRSLREAAAVEDVLQSTIAKTFRDFDLYAEGTNFRAWIFRYLTFEIYAGNRQFARRREQALVEDPLVEEAFDLPVDAPLVEALLERADEVLEHCDEALAQAVHELNPLERSALLLRAVGELKYREIAEVLEVPGGTVMSALARARQRLRRRLAEFGREHGCLDEKPLRKKK